MTQCDHEAGECFSTKRRSVTTSQPPVWFRAPQKIQVSSNNAYIEIRKRALASVKKYAQTMQR